MGFASPGSLIPAKTSSMSMSKSIKKGAGFLLFVNGLEGRALSRPRGCENWIAGIFRKKHGRHPPAADRRSNRSCSCSRHTESPIFLFLDQRRFARYKYETRAQRPPATTGTGSNAANV